MHPNTVRSPGKLVGLPALDLLEVEHWMWEVDDLVILEQQLVGVEVLPLVCQLHLSLCHQDLWYEAAGPRQTAALMWQREMPKDVHLPTALKRTEICLNSSSACNSSEEINGKSTTQPNCSCTKSSCLLAHRIHLKVFLWKERKRGSVCSKHNQILRGEGEVNLSSYQIQVWVLWSSDCQEGLNLITSVNTRLPVRLANSTVWTEQVAHPPKKLEESICRAKEGLYRLELYMLELLTFSLDAYQRSDIHI